MYLKRMDIKGFKSFADHTEITLQPGINIVVGPNGCGKSNIVDAIRWVMGESNVRTLRGQKGEDVIFGGTDHKRAVSMATVEIAIDNDDQFLPLDYREVTLARKVFRSGESEFYINKNKVRMKDLGGLFTGTGLGKKGYSIISQGELEQVLNGQAMERRLILEEASGIIKYRQQRDEVHKRIEQASQDVLRLQDMLADLKERKDELYYKAEKARIYMQVEQEHQDLEKKVLSFELTKGRNDLRSRDEDLKHKQQLLRELQDELVRQRETLQQEEKRLEEARLYTQELRENKHVLGTDIGSITSEVRLSQERVKTAKERVVVAGHDVEKYRRMVDKIEGEIGAFHGDLKEQQQACSAMQAEYDRLQQEVSALEAAILETETAFESSKQEIFEKIQLESRLHNESREKEDRLIKGREKRARLEIHLENFENQLAQKLKSLRHMEQEQQEATLLADKLEQALQDSTKRKQELLGLLHKEEQDIKQLQEQLRQSENHLRTIREMQQNLSGYSQGVKAVMLSSQKGILKGIVGVMGELLEVPRGLEVAVDTAAGRGLENIVVENYDDASQAIQFLKKQKAGRVTLLPLDSLRVRKVPSTVLQSASQFSGVLGLASRLVDYDPRYEAAIEYILGRVLVVENLPAGRKVFQAGLYPFQIVTLEGEVINASGAITGGIKSQPVDTPLQRRQQQKMLEENKRKLEAGMTRAAEKCQGLYEQLQAVEQAVQEQKEKHMESRMKQELLQRESLALQQDIQKHQQENESCQAQLASLDAELQLLAQQGAALLEQGAQLKGDNEQRAAELETIKETLSIRKRDYEVRRERLLAGAEQLEMKKRELETSSKNIDQFDQVRSSYLQSVQEAGQLQQRLEQEIERETRRIALLEESLQENNSRYEILELELQDMLASEEACQQLCLAARESLSPLHEQQSRLENSIKNSEISLVRVDTELNNLEQKWQERFAGQAESSDGAQASVGRVREWRQRMEMLQQQIEEIGPVNIEAVNEYETVSQKHGFLNQQCQDLVDARQSLGNLLRETEKMLSRDFTHFLMLANESFRRIFTEIFEGGEASLKLEADKERLEAGVEIEVKLPGKRLQSLNLLSGGERALTCIAFIFSLLRLKPAPFCLLDEIDASLDEINLLRFTRFLRKMAINTQFVVITHRQTTIAAGENIYGITMQEKGISTVLTLNRNQAESMAG